MSSSSSRSTISAASGTTGGGARISSSLRSCAGHHRVPRGEPQQLGVEELGLVDEPLLEVEVGLREEFLELAHAGVGRGGSPVSPGATAGAGDAGRQRRGRRLRAAGVGEPASPRRNSRGRTPRARAEQTGSAPERPAGGADPAGTSIEILVIPATAAPHRRATPPRRRPGHRRTPARAPGSRSNRFRLRSGAGTGSGHWFGLQVRVPGSAPVRARFGRQFRFRQRFRFRFKLGFRFRLRLWPPVRKHPCRLLARLIEQVDA